MRLPILVVVMFSLYASVGDRADARGKAKAKAKAAQVKFVGVHPIVKAHGGGVCHIEAPHVHMYTPSDVKVQYRVYDEHYHFVGDPVAYGWEGEKYAYYGHHPVDVDYVLGEDDDSDHVESCYLDGAHYHYYAPPPELKFEVESDAYWYVGDMPDAYVDARVELDVIDVVYEPIVYTRPVVVVEEPPPMWVGLRFVVVAPVAEVVVERPRPRPRARTRVEVVAPSLSIEIGVSGGFMVGGHSHGHHKHKKHKGKGKRRH